MVAGGPAQPVHQDPGDRSRACPRSPQRLAEGISVNVTLIFSLERYGQVIDAFLAGLEQAPQAGHDLSTHRLGRLVLRQPGGHRGRQRLDKIGTPEAAALRGKAAIANARLAYELYEERIATPTAGRRCARPGPRPQRPLWASTGAKDPAYEDTMYVVDLVAPGHGQHHAGGHPARHGRPRRAARATRSAAPTTQARQVFADLEALGISYDDVVRVLEDEGVEKFAASWNELLGTIESNMAAVASHDR